LYCSAGFVWVIKSSRMRRAGDVACIVENGEMYAGLWLKETDSLEDLGIDGGSGISSIGGHRIVLLRIGTSVLLL